MHLLGKMTLVVIGIKTFCMSGFIVRNAFIMQDNVFGGTRNVKLKVSSTKIPHGVKLGGACFLQGQSSAELA